MPLNGGLRPPAPGAAPPPPAVPSALWGGTPLLLTSRERRQAIGGKRVCKTMGKRPRSERRRRGSLGLAGGQPAGLSTGHPEGARGRESPRPGIQPSGRSPPAWGSKTPGPRRGSLPCAARYSEYTFPLKCRPPWPTKSSSASPSSRASATSLPPLPHLPHPRNAQRCYRAGRPEHAQPQQSGRGHAGPERPSPEKRRSDAVLGLEYVVTAHQDWFKGLDKAAQDAYLMDSRMATQAPRLRQRSGLVDPPGRAGPHLAVYVVP